MTQHISGSGTVLRPFAARAVCLGGKPISRREVTRTTLALLLAPAILAASLLPLLPCQASTPIPVPPSAAPVERSAPTRAAGADLAIAPTSYAVFAGQTFTATVDVHGAVNLGAFEFTLAYDPALIQVIDVSIGPFLGSTGRSAAAIGPADDPASGTCTFGAYTIGGSPAGPSGDGVLVILTLRAPAEGESDLDIASAQATDHTGNILSLGELTGGHVSAGSGWQAHLPLVSR